MTVSQDLFADDDITCVAPWDNWRITSEGLIRHCFCASSDDIQHEKPTAPGPDLLSHWRSSDQMRTVRWMKQQGQPVPRCARCYHNDRLIGTSHRSRHHFAYGIHRGPWFRDSLEQNPIWPRMQNLDIEPEGFPAYVTIAWGNECNSACIFCNQTFSRQVAQDHAAFGYPHDPVYLDANWTMKPQGEAQYQNLLHMITANDRLIYLKQNGGEPFMQPQSLRLLQDIESAGKSDFNYVINTNGTVWNQPMVDAMQHIQWVKLDFSIETVHASNDYLRWGSNIDQVLSVLERYQQYDSDHFATVLHCLPQALSAPYIHTLIDYCHAHGTPLLANPLTNPAHFRLHVLPQDIKRELVRDWIQRYQVVSKNQWDPRQRVIDDTCYLKPEYQSRDGDISANLRLVVQKIVEEIEEPEPDNIEDLRHRLVDHVSRFDLRHGTDFCKTWPMLADFYHRYRCKT